MAVAPPSPYKTAAQSVLAPRPPAPPYQYPAGNPKDPFAPMSGHDITSAVNHLTGLYGSPLTEAQIGARAQGEIDPILAAITKTANTRASASSAAIKGLTDSYAGQLASTNYGAPYQQAEGQQAAVDAALTQQASGAGDSLAAGLKANLASFGDDPSVAQAAAAQQSRGQNEATATLAGGSSALSNLIAQAAAASAYGQELPGIAKLAGIQGVEQANSQAANDISTGTQNTLATLPGILAAFRSDNANLKGNQASAAANVYETLTGQNLTKATAKAGLVTNQNAAKASAAPHPDSSLSKAYGYSVDQYGNPINGGKPLPGFKKNANGDVVPVGKPPKAASKGPNASLSRVYGYVVDGNGNPILRNGKRIPVAKTTKKKAASPFDVTPTTPGK